MDELERRMNKALKVLNRWVIENEMVINLDKTKYQIFSLLNLNRYPQLKIADIDIQPTQMMTYMGFALDQR